MECPLCRTEFVVPENGLQALPNNYFINSLLLVNKDSEQTQSCDLCDKPDIKFYCIQCEEHMCDSCSACHKKSRATKSHDVVSVSSKPNDSELMKLRKTYCTTHEEQLITLYCYDCKTIACVVCYVDQHNTHKCGDINKSAEEFRQEISSDLKKIAI